MKMTSTNKKNLYSTEEHGFRKMSVNQN
ncbi:uncharacterized protein METZ01_LOCUS26661 [marine metagenome]|uniref:Uncharacterized protein n=1 Tax=marine metagenome TaxID=408172 RepID=A0A381Q6Y1_9ZZZZ